MAIAADFNPSINLQHSFALIADHATAQRFALKRLAYSPGPGAGKASALCKKIVMLIPFKDFFLVVK
jgi:hypothetical protein